MNITPQMLNSLIPAKLNCAQYKDLYKYSPKISQPVVQKACNFRLNSGKTEDDPDYCTCVSEDTDLDCEECCNFANTDALPPPLDKIVNAYCYESKNICNKDASSGCTVPVKFEQIEEIVKKVAVDIYKNYKQINTNTDDISKLKDCVEDKDGNCNSVNKNLVYVSLGVSLVALIIAIIMIFVK